MRNDLVLHLDLIWMKFDYPMIGVEGNLNHIKVEFDAE
jgi:hypothetical protein